MNPDPHSWTQSRAAGKLYELEQRLNNLSAPPSNQTSLAAQEPNAKPKRRTAKQKKNDRIMKRAHVHRKTLTARKNKFGKAGVINPSQRGPAMKEAIRRARRELN
tara:strand:+ start:837 stop:1151 length:315 start_codon:yes stop_codon:yes gene_type:complete